MSLRALTTTGAVIASGLLMRVSIRVCVVLCGCGVQRTNATIARVIVVHIRLEVVIRVLNDLNELDQRLGPC